MNWAVITGLVRDLNLLRDKVETLARWRSEGLLNGIVYATWIEEIDRYDWLRDYLNRHRITLIEIREPEFDVPFTYLHQMKTLYYALGACPDGATVLKLRPDKCTLSPFIRTLLSGEVDQTPGPLPGWPQIFERRIWVQEGVLRHPFLLNDMLYLGGKADLMKLVDFSVYCEILGYRMHTEQIVHSRPFLERFPIFHHYFSLATGVIYSQNESKRVDEVLFGDPFFLEVFATYLLIVQQYFIVGTSDRAPEQRARVADSLAQLTYTQAIDPGYAGVRPELEKFGDNPALCFTGDAWLDPFLNGGLLPDALGERLLNTVRAMRDYGQQARYTGHPYTLPEAARTLARNLFAIYPDLPFPTEELSPPATGSRVFNGREALVEVKS